MHKNDIVRMGSAANSNAVHLEVQFSTTLSIICGRILAMLISKWSNVCGLSA